MPLVLRAFWQVQFTRTAHHAIAFFSTKSPGKIKLPSGIMAPGRATMVFRPTRAFGAPLRSELSYLVQLLPGRYSSGHYLDGPPFQGFLPPQILVPDR